MFMISVIPFDRNKEMFDIDLLNRSLLNKHVIAYQAEFFHSGDRSYWTVFIEYDPAVEKPPQKVTEDLDDTQKVLLERLRVWRKERAEKEGVPVFIIATNSELANIVRNVPTTLEALKEVRGFGKGKVRKYGQDILAVWPV